MIVTKLMDHYIRLAYAMTFNKSQGQTLDKVGIYLRQPVFDHGQLYVSFSRVRSSEYFKVLVMQFEQLNNLEFVYTDNVVYRQNFF